MKDNKKKSAIVTDEEVLKRISPNYRFMNVDETNFIREFYVGVRFSKSKKHRSYQYINYSCYKPISNLFLKQLLKINEANRIL
jgi:hypothetical protein